MKKANLEGIINLNKSPGITSCHAVTIIKKLFGAKAGHAGTLDPMASGVLPVCLGQATRITEYLTAVKKVYRAEITLGTITSTFDAEGEVISKRNTVGLNRKRALEVLKEFTGTIEQVPPMYSAVKHKGERLYQIARRGLTINQKSRRIKIYRLELLSYKSPIITIEVECSKGTYIRTLANDIGQHLGYGAYLSKLLRSRCGMFSIEDTFSLEDLEEAAKKNALHKIVIPTNRVLSKLLPSIYVSYAEGKIISNGGSIPVEKVFMEEKLEPNNNTIVLNQDSALLAIGRIDLKQKKIRPFKVFNNI